MILTNTKERSRFLRFALVGAIGAVIDLSTFNLLTNLVHLPALLAQGISFTIAVVSNFTWNRLWTYPDARGKPLRHQLIQFVAVSLIGLAIRTPLFNFLESRLIELSSNILPPNFLSPTFVGHNLSLAIVILVVMLWNYIANRYWTYNDIE